MEREVQTLLSHLHTADETRREVGVNVELSVSEVVPPANPVTSECSINYHCTAQHRSHVKTPPNRSLLM